MNSININSKWGSLENAANDLNTESDRFRESIQALDERLKRLGLGLKVWIPLTGESSAFIGYYKLGNRWGLCLKRETEGQDTEYWLMADAPRDLRVIAILDIPVLLSEITAYANDMSARIQRARKDMKGFVDSIDTMPKSFEGEP